MKRGIVWIAIVAVVLLVSSPSFAAFPKPDYYQYYSMRLGWWDNQQAWFVSTTTNNISISQSTYWSELWNPYFPCNPTLSGRLSRALDSVPRVARPVYLVTNASQGPVFDTRPGEPDYSGIWQVFLVTWKPGMQRGFTNTEPATLQNPNGLPAASEADIVESGIVADLPIVAIGPLGGPWQPAPPGGYRIKQAYDYDLTGIVKTILLPHYYVFAVDPVTGKQVHAEVAITDAGNQPTADLFGANYAPGLNSMHDADTQALWVMNAPKPPSQLPIVEQTPTITIPNTNRLYTPLMGLIYLDRSIPAYTVVNNPKLVRQYLTANRLTPVGSVKVNASVSNVFMDSGGIP